MRRYLIFAVALVAAAVCVRLGMWQLDRREQRQVRNGLIATRLAMPPSELTRDSEADSLGFRKVSLRGSFDFERQIVVVARSYDGAAAVNVVTPLRLSGGKAVLVERGRVSSPDAKTVDLDGLVEPDSAVVVGVLVPVDGAKTPGKGWPRYVRYANPADFEAEYPYGLFPLVLRRTELPATAPPNMAVVPLPELTGGPHLSYAIQWFAFATIALVGSAVLFVRSSRERGPAPVG
ncbi:MAG: SURF1 family protein [Gemmatimonadota bacterium]|nr:MAG: SURF1 family protein [Gemmatimonadota bacterium]